MGGVRRQTRLRVDIPRQRRGRVLDPEVAGRDGRAPPALDRAAVAARVAQRWIGEERLPPRRVRQLLHGVLAEQDRPGARIDELLVGQRPAAALIEDDRLVGGADALRHGRECGQAGLLHLLEARHVEASQAALPARLRAGDVTCVDVLADVGGRLEPGVLGRQRRRRGRVAVTDGRGGDVGDVTVDDAHGDQAVLSRRQRAEGLLEEDGVRVAAGEGRVVQEAKTGKSPAGEAEEAAVPRDEAASGGHRIVAEAGGQISPVVDQRAGRAEAVPARPSRPGSRRELAARPSAAPCPEGRRCRGGRPVTPGCSRARTRNRVQAPRYRQRRPAPPRRGSSPP